MTQPSQVRKPVWHPSEERIAGTPLHDFCKNHTPFHARGAPRQKTDYEALLRWSLADGGDFWHALWRFANVAGETGTPPPSSKRERGWLRQGFFRVQG